MSKPTDHDLLDAFADGELDEAEHAEVLNRLRDDPECQTHVEGVTRMREALTTMWRSETAPDGARERVRAALRNANEKIPVGARRADGGAFRLRPHPYGHVWSPWRVCVVGLAACAALVVVSWQFWPEGRKTRASVIDIPARLVSSANELHRATDPQTTSHVPTDRTAVQTALSAQLGLEVFAPDLGAHGYVFRSGRTCMVEDVPGAHLVYEHEKSHALLSVFSVPRIEWLRSPPPSPGVRQVFASDDGGLNTVVWHDRGQTFLVAGTVKRSDILTLLDMVELALRAGTSDAPGGAGIRFAAGTLSDYDAPVRDESGLDPESTLRADVRRTSRRGRAEPQGIGSVWIGPVWQTIVMGRS